MGPVRVVMRDVLGKYCFEVTAPEDEHPVEALAPDGADHALADRIGTRCSDQGGDESGAVGSEDGVEGGGAFGVGIADGDVTGFAWSSRSIERLRACWVTQSATGFDVMPSIRTRRLSWWMNTST